jgi:MinD-like ATPase involved in chromosome partitioning or flagellar assembly
VTVPVLTAVGDPRREADLVAGLSANGHGVHVARRCVDLADLLAAAAAGLGRAVLLSADLRRLDREALTRLAVAGVAVVGLVTTGDEPAERRLRQLGVREIVDADADVDVICTAVIGAVGAAPGIGPHDFAEPRDSLARPAPDRPSDDGGPAANGGPATEGHVLAVWGPTGAPGRTCVATGLAAELAALGAETLLVDADSYGGVVAQVLGLLDESPGLAAACRLANNGTLDAAALAELSIRVGPHLRVLTGITRAERWPELRPSGLEAVLAVARRLARFVVVDCGFGLERDEELSFDTAAPRRNGATLAALDAADTVLAVATADPVGLQRLVRSLGELADVLPGCTPVTIVNRLRPGAVGPGDPEREIGAALQRYAGLSDVRFVPLDVEAFDRALATGRTLVEVAPSSPARQALQTIAAGFAGTTVPRPRRGLSLRRR